MKQITTTFVAALTAFSLFCQQNSSIEKFVRQDTTILKAEECEWMFGPQSGTVNSVPQAILETVQSGKLKAFDSQTNELIPGNKIFTWRQATDTMMVWDTNKVESVLKIIQHKLNPEYLTRIRVYHDWYLNTTTGKIESKVKTVELMGEVRTPSSGDIIGYIPLYRIQF
jgi:hypothetical protein